MSTPDLETLGLKVNADGSIDAKTANIEEEEGFCCLFFEQGPSFMFNLSEYERLNSAVFAGYEGVFECIDQYGCKVKVKLTDARAVMRWLPENIANFRRAQFYRTNSQVDPLTESDPPCNGDAP